MSFETLRDLTVHAVGGGWGQDVPDERHTEAVAVIRGTDIPRIAAGDYSSVPRRFETISKVKNRLLQAGDIVIEVSGGSAASGQHTGRAVAVSAQTIERLGGRVIPASFCRLLRLDVDKVDPTFICYQIQSLHLSGEIAEFENQSTGIANFQFARFVETVRPELGDVADQRNATSVLRLLDDRITLLRETNATLEAIAQALFKSWFVDFDPVRAKMEGRTPEGMDDATAALFPDALEESELGWMPKGWRVGTLADVASLNAQSLSPRNPPPKINYIDLAGVKANVFDVPQCCSFADAPSRARRVLRDGDCIVGTVRPGNRSFGFIATTQTHLIGSTGFAVLSPKQHWMTAFTYLCATRDESIDRLASLADGGAYPAVRPDVVASTPCTLPPDEVMKVFDGAARSLLDVIGANSEQAQTLATLRDTLLPRLISGQLQLPEAQATLEAALGGALLA